MAKFSTKHDFKSLTPIKASTLSVRIEKANDFRSQNGIIFNFALAKFCSFKVIHLHKKCLLKTVKIG